MRFFDRIRAKSAPNSAAQPPTAPAVLPRPETLDVAPPPIGPTVLHGHATLEVVGESHYQDHLWRLAGGVRAEQIRCTVQAVLAPEPENPYDANAVRVLIEDGVVGYLSRDDAAVYRPGLVALMKQYDSAIALGGHILGGGHRSDGIGLLGVFLDHDPADFGLLTREIAHIGELRTGLSQAVATDLADDAYDLSWYDKLSGRGPRDIVTLRQLLAAEREPIDRHFMLSELGKCLYASRDAFSSALPEFDGVCEQHHSEMHTIRAALYEKFDCIPVIDMYRQASIRCQKARDWYGARTWAERGLAVYGSAAARPEAVVDLQKRLAHAEAKIYDATTPRDQPRPRPAKTTSPTTGGIESLTCVNCGQAFERSRIRGRKPQRCPACRDRSDAAPKAR
ncbi:MAG TPA: HIRAN domain-containing protein [Solirubrobacteraceae bacterium]